MGKNKVSTLRKLLLVFAYIFAFVGMVLVIIYFTKNGYKIDDSTIDLYLDFGMICGGLFFLLKGYCDFRKSFEIRVRDSHFLWVYSRIFMLVGVLMIITSIILLIFDLI